MPDLGIFGQHDPLSGKTLDPYGYAYQNPVFFSDPTGLEGDPVPGSSGTGNPQAIGTAASPIDVGEVILNSPVKAVASNTLSIMPSNCLVCNGGGISAPRLQNTSTPNIPEITRSYKNFYPYQPDDVPEWYGPGGKANWFLGTSATTIGYMKGSFRLTNGVYNGSVWSPKYYQSAWKGGSRARISTYNIGKIGGVLSEVSFGAGLVMDAKGVLNYKDNPNSPNAVHPGKDGLNTVMGIIGYKGGVYGAIISTLYFGVDNFYPGGWVGASETAARTEAYEQQMTGHPFFSNSAIKF